MPQQWKKEESKKLRGEGDQIKFIDLNDGKSCPPPNVTLARVVILHVIALTALGKSMGVKHTMLPDGQPPTVAFIVFAQLCGPTDNETEMGAALFTKNGEVLK